MVVHASKNSGTRKLWCGREYGDEVVTDIWADADCAECRKAGGSTNYIFNADPKTVHHQSKEGSDRRCGAARSDGHVWTADPAKVTCADCLKLLEPEKPKVVHLLKSPTGNVWCNKFVPFVDSTTGAVDKTNCPNCLRHYNLEKEGQEMSEMESTALPPTRGEVEMLAESFHSTSRLNYVLRWLAERAFDSQSEPAEKQQTEIAPDLLIVEAVRSATALVSRGMECENLTGFEKGTEEEAASLLRAVYARARKLL